MIASYPQVEFPLLMLFIVTQIGNSSSTTKHLLRIFLQAKSRELDPITVTYHA